MANNSQHCWMLAVASVYTRCCMLFRVVHVGSCSNPLLPNFQQHSQWLHDKLTWFLLRALKAANLVVLSLIVFTGLGGLGLSICQKRHKKDNAWILGRESRAGFQGVQTNRSNYEFVSLLIGLKISHHFCNQSEVNFKLIVVSLRSLLLPA